jgi:ribosomal protein S18 acetylase RimI-like enzyme
MLPVFQIRKANPEDSNQIFQLILELAHYERAPQEVINTPEKILQHGFGETPLFSCWVAIDLELPPENQIVGIAVCYIRYSTWKGPVLYLEDIVIKEEYRRNGIGTSLFKACLRYAKEKEFSRMSWQVLDWNEPAIKFYEKYGSNFDSEWLNCYIDIANQSLE